MFRLGTSWLNLLIDLIGCSLQLVKNEVRISSNLLYSLGFPASGRVVFVQPIYGGSLTKLVPGNGELHRSPVDYCKELYIRLLPFRSASALSMDASSPSKNGTDKTLNLYENGSTSSPRTPSLGRSRPCSPSPGKLSSLASEDLLSHVNGIKRSYFDTVEMQEILGDKSANTLLQRTAVSWLYSRALLCGNLVAVPILSRLCLFEVVGLKSLSYDSTDRDPTQTSLVHSNDEVFIIDRATKVKIYLPSDLPPDTSEKGISTPGKMDSKKSNVNMADEKLGGLWKEYTLLRDIISASVKNALSRLDVNSKSEILFLLYL